jgi:hypothetical protein
MVFTFAGSSHSKYATYLLETLVNLELECSPELRETILSMMLVNLTGKAGSFSPGDLVQEYFNRLFQAIVERKGKEFDHSFIRRIVSRNLHHMGRAKKDLEAGVGLMPKSGRHSAPHTKPEVVTLLTQYRLLELHSRRPGRTIDDHDVDDFQRGWEKLEKGRLASWVLETTRSRNIRSRTSPIPPELDIDNTDEEETTENGETTVQTIGGICMVDGEMVVNTMDKDELVAGILSELEYAGDESDDCDEDGN